MDDSVVESELDGDVEGVDPGKGDFVDHHWPQRIEEDLEGAEEGFPGHGVEEPSFERSGQIRVQSIDPQTLVVCKMIWSERRRVRYPDWQVGKDG